jgi:hypothetical protein
MKKDNTPDAGRNRRVQSVLSTISIVLGLVLLAYMVTVEDEPGAIPLLLIVVGIGWKLVTRYRVRSHTE